MLTRGPLAVAVALALLAPSGVLAQTPAPPPSTPTITLTLEESLRAALNRAPEVRQAGAEVEGIRGKQLQAQGAGYPQIELTTVLGPSPRARGDQVSSPDDKYDLSLTGVFIRAGFEIIQPIFTWGLIRNARQAAEHGIRATQAGVDVKATEVSLKVKQAYWGAVAARNVRDFLLEVRDQVDRATVRAEQLIDSGHTTEADVYRLRTAKGELQKNINLAEKNLGLARHALAVWTGQSAAAAVEPATATLPAELRDLRPIESFIEDARAKRPEFTQLAEGIRARQRLVDVERKKRYPLFFLGIVGLAAYATNRDRIDNPFVYDPLNDYAVGPVIGFKYNLDFGIAAGKIKEAEAEVHKLEALQAFAQDGVPLQVRETYNAVVEARGNVQAFDEAHQNARKWLVAASSNFDLGIGDPSELSDAYFGYARTRGEYFLALYSYVYGLEQLAHAAGLDVEEAHRLAPDTLATERSGKKP